MVRETFLYTFLTMPLVVSAEQIETGFCTVDAAGLSLVGAALVSGSSFVSVRSPRTLPLPWTSFPKWEGADIPFRSSHPVSCRMDVGSLLVVDGSVHPL